MSSSSEVLGDAAVASASDAQQQEQHPHLRTADVGLSNKRAQLRGTALGVSLGLVSMLVLGRSGRVSANAAVLAGMATGSAGGYIATRVNLRSELQRLEQQTRGRHDEMVSLDLKAGAQRSFDAGVGGLYDLRDRGSTTRGDH
ncbi:hypothetical protein FA10DRAFT_266389 [Acaromyces ingoldii]|uniref:Uncharacterized protein n=1 Tax=Acaromyces ingoldii TaxID=215250 RepID=A0A316YP63_9BASI|nr:hypothetical protein FA10DRAFT_266389 [Acaromyces ingoldii]PWN89843.1 hypothetical protein FA10DRAFT_266389 [Acaromyces ingoldii]